MTQDRNFDDIADRFQQSIYDSNKGAVRLGIVWDDLIETITLLSAGRPLRILDAGVGTGQMALRLARMGHELVLCDISAKMLAKAQALFDEQLPEAKVTFLHTPVQALEQYSSDQFDVIIFHAVLEWLAQPRETLLGLVRRHLKPGGYLSLLFYNRHGLEFRHLLHGNFAMLREGKLRGKPGGLTPDNPLDPDEVKTWVSAAGLDIVQHSGVRVITDYMTSSAAGSLSLEEMLAMERRYANVDPYRMLGRYIHLICRAETTQAAEG